jgi:hypothetical protein
MVWVVPIAWGMLGSVQFKAVKYAGVEFALRSDTRSPGATKPGEH